MKNKDKKKSVVYCLGLFKRSVKLTYSLDKIYFWMQIVNAVLDTLRPYLNSFMASVVINGIIDGKPTKTLITYAIIVVVINFTISAIIQFTAGRRSVRRTMWPRFITRYFNSYSEKMDFEYFENVEMKQKWKRVYDCIANNRGVSSSFEMVQFMASCITGFVSSVAVIVSLLMMRSNEPQTGILAAVNSPWAIPVFIAFIILMTYLTKFINAKSSSLYNVRRDFWAKADKYDIINSFSYDNKRAMDMRIYGMHAIAEEESEAYDRRIKNFSKKNYLLSCFYNIAGKFLNLISKAYSFVFIGLKALSGAFSIGSFVFYSGTMQQFIRSINNIGWFIGDLEGDISAYEDQYSYIDVKNKMYQGCLTVEKRDDRDYTVQFCNVSFKYPGCDEYVLKNINLTFKIGERLAVVGMNGSGKTTFIKLMCRLYDPTEGEILLNGIDIRKYNYKEYMSIFSVVFQDFKLFSFSLGKNVATGLSYDPERAEKCLKDAGFGERLATLPKGLDTPLYKDFDADGVEISGGEAQKIALARALYKNAPFIILDEPTAALDPIAEAEVYSNFNNIVGDKTAIYISHRLSSCRFCDSIVVFDNGEIIQRGTHDELVGNKTGKYHELWHAQAQYYTT